MESLEIDAFIESLDLSGFQRQQRVDPVDEALAQVYEALFAEDEPDDEPEGAREAGQG